MKKLNVKLRLTLWYATVLVIILGALFTGIYVMMKRNLEAAVHQKLQRGYDSVTDVVWGSGGDIYDIYHLGQNRMFRVRWEGDKEYQTRSWIGAGLTPILEDGRVNDKAGSTGFKSLKSEDGRHYMFLVDSIPEYGFELTFAEETSDFAESARDLGLILAAAFPGAIVLAALGGYFLANRALAPVSDMAEKARRITAKSLSERLPVANREDELGRLALVFNDTLNRLEKSFNQLQRFTSDASHELRIPLTAMKSVGEVALSGRGDEKSCREAIESMLEETDRLASLTDALLLLARGESGTSRISPSDVDIAELAGSVVDDLTVLAEEKGQSIKLICKTDAVLHVDRGTLNQALANVIHNSISYTPEGGNIEVRIGIKDGGEVFIDVIDDGPGIPPEARERIFDRFYRLDKARSRSEGGSGLGLSIARWAVDINGGKIHFLDKASTGSHCRIELPKT